MTTQAPRARVEELASALRKITSPTRVSTTPPDRIAYSRDLWPRGLLGIASGQLGAHPPDAVVWPESAAEISAIVKLCVERKVPIVPFGAGSGVCGGTIPLSGGLVVDLKRMRRLLHLDGDSLTATFEAGILGEHLEHELERRGYTLGHFPSSIMCSTLGGWLAARSAGQCSSRYGKIEDMVRSIEVVIGTGERIETRPFGFAQDALGPDLTQLLVGSEGTLGIITRAEMAIRPAPEVRHLRGFAMPRLATGCEAIRRVMQRGLRPSVVRLYDELDTLIAGRSRDDAEAAPHAPGAHDEAAEKASWFDVLAGREGRKLAERARRRVMTAALGHTNVLNHAIDWVLPHVAGGCLLIVGCEGDRRLADVEAKAAFHEIEAAGGRDLGPGPGERWLRHRYDVSYKLSKSFAMGAFADTMEVAVTWDRLLDLYRAVKEAVAPLAFIMAHFSHAYEEGCSIYFTFAASVGGGDNDVHAAERKYDDIWRAALGAANRVGATISHHHGVGLSKAAFMPAEHGASMAIFHALKRALDPHGILNPGKLGV